MAIQEDDEIFPTKENKESIAEPKNTNVGESREIEHV